jgi:hypothetical protein
VIIIADLPYRGLVLRQAFRRVLAALAASDADALRLHKLPPLYSSGVVYRPEPEAPRMVLGQLLNAAPGEGVELWDSPWKCMRQGWADCDDACRWRLAELYQTEWAYPAVASRGDRHHVMLRRNNGALEDPARMILRPGTHLG